MARRLLTVSVLVLAALCSVGASIGWRHDRIFLKIHGGANTDSTDAGAIALATRSNVTIAAVAPRAEAVATSVNFTEALLKRFDAASSGEAILQLAEEIPAIRRCVDKAMRIIIADYTDAMLAAHAIQRLANVTTEGLTQQGAGIDWTPSALDRRFEQLTECVELRAPQLPILTLSRYCWCLSSLKIADEEQVAVIFGEYSARLQGSKNKTSATLSSEELATMLWTVGCIRDTCQWAPSAGLVMDISSALLERAQQGGLQRLRLSMLLRALWTLSLHVPHAAASNKALATECLLSLRPRLGEIGDKSAVAVLNACAKLKLHSTEVSAMTDLLQKLSPGMHLIAMADYAAAGEALSVIYSQLSGTARQVGMTQPDAPIVQLVSLVEKASIALINAASLLPFSILPVGSISALVHLAGVIDIVDDRAILESGVRQIESLLAVNVTLSPVDASLFFESIALLTWTIRREKGFHTTQRSGKSGGNATTPLSIFLTSQRLAGHMSAICSARAADLQAKSPSALLSAAWAGACYARPCAKMTGLLHNEMRENSYDMLRGLDPAGLGKVAVVVASNQQADSTFRGEKNLYAKVIGTLLPLVVERAMEIAPVGLQISVLTAIAEIAQGGVIAEISQDAQVAQGGALKTKLPLLLSCALSSADLDKLRTSSLIKFLWAVGRLPDGLVSNETMSAAQTILLGRKIGIFFTGRYSSNSAHATEFRLLAKLLADARKPNGRLDNNLIDVVLRNVLKTMALHLPDVAASDPPGVGVAAVDLLSASGTADLVALGEIIMALIDFKVYNAELVRQCLRCIKNEVDFHVAHPDDDSSASCRRLFDLGRLEGLLSTYRTTVGNEADQRKGFRFFR